MRNELHISNPTSINFMVNGVSYRVEIDNEFGLLSLYKLPNESDNDILLLNYNIVQCHTESDIEDNFVKGCDYGKIYDLLVSDKEGFLMSYSYLPERAYDISFAYLKRPHELSILYRQAENLFQMESDMAKEDIEYMQEPNTDYISSADWKWAIQGFIVKNLTKEEYMEFEEYINSCGC